MPPPLAYYPGTDPLDTVEALYSEQGPRHPAIAWCSIALILSAVAALPWVRIDLAVRGRGVVAASPVSVTQFFNAEGKPPRIRIEAFLPEQDLSRLRVGQAAGIRYDAYPYSEWSGAAGTVEAVSPEPVVFGTQALIRVMVGSATTELALPDGRRGPVAEGMTATVSLVVDRPSLLELICRRSRAQLGL
jgi:hypothetical protein